MRFAVTQVGNAALFGVVLREESEVTEPAIDICFSAVRFDF